MINFPMPFQLMQSEAMMLPPSCFTVLTLDHHSPQCWIYFNMRKRFSSIAPASDPYAIHALIVCDDPKGEASSSQLQAL